MPISDPILIFTILISVILIAPLLAERLRVPDLVLLLLAGLVLGPHGAGLLARGSAISLFGAVGLLYIMFIAGLEIDLHRFTLTWKRSLSFGLMTFAIPQGLGILIGYYVLNISGPASVLLGSMFASHTLLPYPIASRLGIARNEAVTVTVSATIIADTLALLVLAVIADSAKGADIDLWFWLGIILGIVMLFSLVWWGIPWVSRWFFNKVPEKSGAQFLFVLATVCCCAYLSHFAKMEPIIGAFLAGAAFNRLIPEQSALMNRVQFVGNTLFIPFFLISVGMLVNLRALSGNPRSWFVLLTMVVAAIVTKWLAAWLAAWLFGYRAEERNVMFGLSVVKAAATLAVVLVGYHLKIFDETVLNGTIVMIIVTCSLGAVVVERYGRRLAALASGRVVRPSTEQRLVVPVANPASATRLLDFSFLLRNPGLPGAIHAVTIVRDEQKTASAVAQGEKLLAHCLTHAASADTPLLPGVRVGINVSDGIIHMAKEVRAESVLIGWSDQWTAAGRLFGTVRENLLDECPARILLCRLERPLNTTRRLLLALPPLSEQRSDILSLLRDAKWLAKQTGSEMRVYMSNPSSEQRLQAMIEAAGSSVPVRFLGHVDWSEARLRLFNSIRADDMVILPVERRQSPLWSPSLERLPEIAISRFPDINILSVYPALHGADGQSASSQDTSSGAAVAIFPSGDLRGEANVEDVLRHMTGGVSDWTRDQQDAARSLLLDSARTFPVEIQPGTVLLHAHSEIVTVPTILIGTGDWKWSMPGIDSPPRIILGLISPRDKGPEIHLKMLSTLARCLRNHPVLKKPYSVWISSEIAAVLRECFGGEGG
ncbi:MAG: cation:proton antiporter [Desulfobacteraceae bacterium]|nr:MAG: cation:proton antiporter [Desulfobacteraceae bacterium]